jgi:hypothetical protein
MTSELEQSGRKPRQRRTPAERAAHDFEVAKGRLARAHEASTRADKDLEDAKAGKKASDAEVQAAEAVFEHMRRHPELPIRLREQGATP